MLFHRGTRSRTKTIKAPAYLEHYSVVQLTQNTAKKNRKLIDDETSYLAALTDHAAYARWQGFPEPLFLEYVSHLVESEVQERLNRMSTCLPVDSHFAFQPLLKIGPCSRWFKMSNVFPILFHLIWFVLFF